MPSNRQGTAREERIDEVLDAAQELFLDRGFARTTISDIARRTGVAPGAVYWYFPSKEHAFAAVLNRMIDTGLDRIRPIALVSSDPVEALLTALAELQPFRGLQSTVHDLALRSEVVGEVHQRFHRELESLLVAALSSRLPPGEPRLMAIAAVTATLDGALAHQSDQVEVRELLRFVIDRVAPGN